MLSGSSPSAADPPAPSARRLGPAIALLCIVGLILRVLAARGDLWLDEIWSLIIVGKVSSLADVVVGLPHDNNHVLNSLWLKIVGDGAPSLVLRAPAVLFGTLCVPVAARIGARISPTASLATALVVAVDYTFVHFGSEARGYSGLILAILLAVDAMEAWFEDGTRRSLILFALAVAFGTFSHLVMIEATGLLCAVGWLRIIQRAGLRKVRPGDLVALPIAATAGTLPALLCFLVSLTAGPLHVGLSGGFSFADLAEGLGGIVRTTLGLFDRALPIAVSEAILLVGAVVVVALLPALPPSRRWLPLLGILGLPLLHAAFHLPNLGYVRFHLVTGVLLALFAAELWATAWDRGGGRRALAIVLALLLLVGQSVQLGRFLTTGRGDVSKVATLVGGHGATRIGVLPEVAGGETAAILRWAAKRQGTPTDLSMVPNAMLCATPPDWLLIIRRPDDPFAIDDAARLAATGCPERFAAVATFPAYGLSGFAMTVLRASQGR